MPTIKEIFDSDPGIKAIRVFKDGHVPNSDDLDTFGVTGHYVRDDSRTAHPDGYRAMVQQYNRKDSGPTGPAWIAIGYRGGIRDRGKLLPDDVSPSDSPSPAASLRSSGTRPGGGWVRWARAAWHGLWCWNC